MQSTTLARINQLKSQKVVFGLVTRLSDGAQDLVLPKEGTPALADSADARSEILTRLQADRPGRLEANPDLFLTCHLPPLRLAIIGAVHIAQPLIPMARLAGYEPIVIDPRRGWATAERFPDVAIDHTWPDAALAAFALDSRSAVVFLTHDPKIDDPGLQVALNSEAFYIGALGSTRTHAKRLARLAEAGVEQALLARIHAPIGLDLGGRSPAEVATAVLAEIIAARHGHLAKVGR